MNRDFDELEKMPTYPNHIFLDNGIYDIQTKTLQKYSTDFIVGKKIENIYNTNAKCPMFLKFINDFMCGDVDLIRSIQEIIGYILVDSKKLKSSFILWCW
ncbi:hypothetical protein [Clostridioides difficile]|uniref:hypothetical protein n=1 Tax=Clostridioides difficile TaxID=1496 RepID=UPI0022391F20|nr:hypothetical protein [Clostridioides difficile]MDL0353365.1 hypothetical protein [Clostridioides difficile]